MNDKNHQQQQPEYQFNNYHGRGKRRGRERGKGRDEFESSTHKANSGDKSNVECYGCHRYGHHKFKCHTNLPNPME